jgi:hypothetical protein
MNEDNFNISMRRFLKMVGVKSQHEIEQAVTRACADGRLKGVQSLAASMVLRIPDVGLEISFDGRIELE